MDKDKVTIEEAINRTGFGLYSFFITCLAGTTIISFACIGYGNTILVPASACELETTAAQQGVLAAMPIIGSIIGSLLWGYLSDTRGRRNMIIVALLGGAVMNCVASISVNWIMLTIIQFIAALFVAGLYSMAMSLLSESVPMMKRNLVVLLVTSIFMLAQGIMAVLAIPIIPLSYSIYIPALGIYWNSWRTLMIVYAMPSVFTALALFFMNESPKFTLSKGDEKRTLAILQSIYRVNRWWKKGDLDVHAILKEEVKNNNPDEKQSQIVPLFQAPLLKYTIIMTLLYAFQQMGSFIVWLPTIANQFVQIIQTGEGTDQPLCSVIAAAVDAPVDEDAVPCAINVTALLIVLGVGALQSIVNLILSVVVSFIGRRNVAICLALVCGLSGIVVNLVPNAIGSAVLFAIMLQGMLVLGMYTAIIVAIFPTRLRTTAIALPLMGGRMATFASVQILNLMLINVCEAGFYLFASIFASSAIVLLFLPDDRRLQPPPALAPTPQEKEDNGTTMETTTRDMSQL